MTTADVIPFPGASQPAPEPASTTTATEVALRHIAQCRAAITPADATVTTLNARRGTP